jgi:hypothetical protein
MLWAAFLMAIYLGFRLGTSSETRDFAPGAAEQLAARTSIEGKLPSEARDSREFFHPSRILILPGWREGWLFRRE